MYNSFGVLALALAFLLTHSCTRCLAACLFGLLLLMIGDGDGLMGEAMAIGDALSLFSLLSSQVVSRAATSIRLPAIIPHYIHTSGEMRSLARL